VIRIDGKRLWRGRVIEDLSVYEIHAIVVEISDRANRSDSMGSYYRDLLEEVIGIFDKKVLESKFFEF
jgi:hypothetical protein